MLTFTSPTVLGLARQQARTFFSRRWMSLWSEVKEIASRKKVTIQNLRSLKQKGTPITTLTAYGYPSGVRCERADIDITFVGDSLAQVALGYDATTRLTLDEMIYHVRAVARGSHSSFLLADMPFGTYHASVEDAIRPAVRLVREGGAEGVKLEGRQEVAPIIKALTSIEIPAMAQVGLLPQRYAALSGYRVQGKNVASAIELLQAVNECQQLYIPTIGIGAGPGCDGHVLVQDDALDICSGHKAKFVQKFAEIGSTATEGANAFAKAVRERSFPSLDAKSYGMDSEEWVKFAQHEHIQAVRGCHSE
ncbi:3-methyl-2-oxobutanoate hydroxymethyltransferase [Rhizoctonia solani]|uniref:3-methyl-2-oxobutanoate hydroxymethyltransferase n=1 Tax=Rhizoctonia solani TaxID=456999 RepID=A0A8H7H077_9AGAM|nr:3-methyl-2-oxobutanoate hydroxymethyltransferase [Rhizoctonia solani]